MTSRMTIKAARCRLDAAYAFHGRYFPTSYLPKGARYNTHANPHGATKTRTKS